MKKIKLLVIGVALLEIGGGIAVKYLQGKSDFVDTYDRNIPVEINVTSSEVKDVPNELQDTEKPKEKSKTELFENHDSNSKVEVNTKVAKTKTNVNKSDTSIHKQNENKNSENALNNSDKKENKETSQNKTETVSDNNSKQETVKSENTNKNNQKQEEVKTDKVVEYYRYVTGGKKEFSSEEQALAKGREIKNNELDYVLDYNMKHIDAQIKTNISNYVVYPSVVDSEGKTWYYLHFVCEDGINNDEKLKEMFKNKTN